MNDKKKSLVDVPVLLIFFIRPDTFEQVFKKVRQARPSKLFLACDGPRKDHPQDAEKIAECKKIAENIDWECEVYTDYATENLGCGRRPYTAISWALSIVDRIVILEDDCVPCESFFPYVAELLEKYKEDNRIGMISGLNHFKDWNCGGNSYCFTKTGAIWGWATWRRVWKKYDYTVKNISSEYYCHLLKNEIGYTRVAKRRIQIWKETYRRLQSGENISFWDHQFGFEKFSQSLLTIVPCHNQISNCGVGEGSSHTIKVKAKEWKKGMIHYIPTTELDIPLKHPELVICDRAYDTAYYKLSYPSSVRRVFRKINRIIKM